MSDCSVPCPPFTETTLNVVGICDCRAFNTPGNPDCPIHGDMVRMWLDGYQAALDTLKAAHAELYRSQPYYGSAK